MHRPGDEPDPIRWLPGKDKDNAGNEGCNHSRMTRIWGSGDTGPYAFHRHLAARDTPWTASAPYDPTYIHPEGVARARRNLMAYEVWHPLQLTIGCCNGSAALFPLAWLARGSPAITGLALVGCILCLVATVIVPRYI